MARADCASFSLVASLTNTTATTATTVPPKLLKPLLSFSIHTPLPRRKLTKRKNYLRPKILKTLPKPLKIDPVIPVTVTPEYDAVYEQNPLVNEIVGIVPVVDEAEVEEIQVSKTEGFAGEYSGIFSKFSAKSVLKIGFGLVAVFVLQTIYSVLVLGNVDSEEKNKHMNVSDKGINARNKGNISKQNLGYLDRIELEDKVNEIRAMAREAREIEGRKLRNGGEEGGNDNKNVNSEDKNGIEEEIDMRLVKLEKKLNSRKGKLRGSHINRLDEVEDSEDEGKKQVDKMLMFKKKFKFREPSASSRSDVKGFSSSEGRGVNEKRKSGFTSANGDTMESNFGLVGMEKSGNETSDVNVNCLQNDAENLEKMSKEMQVKDGNKRFGTIGEIGQGRSREVMKSRISKNLETQNLQDFTKEDSQETTTKSNKEDILVSDSSEHRILQDNQSAKVSRGIKSDIEPDFWWSKLPYVLAILTRRGLEDEELGGLFALKIASEVPELSEASYTVAFEDHSDANNFCFLLESFFEDLSDFSADVVPLPVKEVLEAVKSSTKKVIVVKKGQLKLYAGQPLEDVEKALHTLIEQNHGASMTNVTMHGR